MLLHVPFKLLRQRCKTLVDLAQRRFSRAVDDWDLERPLELGPEHTNMIDNVLELVLHFQSLLLLLLDFLYIPVALWSKLLHQKNVHDGSPA